MRVRVVFLPNCPLIFSLHNHRSVGVFLNQKNEKFKQKSPLNSSIDIYAIKYITQNNISPLSNCCLSSSPPPPLFLNISLTTMNKPKTQHNHHSNSTTRKSSAAQPTITGINHCCTHGKNHSNHHGKFTQPAKSQQIHSNPHGKNPQQNHHTKDLTITRDISMQTYVGELTANPLQNHQRDLTIPPI